MRRVHYRLMLGTAFLAAMGLTLIVFKTQLSSYKAVPERSLDSYQQADGPLAVDSWDPRMVLLDAWERALIPVANEFSAPLGSGNGAMTYNAQAFMDPNAARGGNHSGDDLNGIGGMNTDLGDAVYAAADGLVVYSGVPSAGWGGVMILAHRLPEGQIVQSFYGHLGDRYFLTGDVVGRGEIISVLGTALASTAAHLHFEMISSAALEAGQPGYLALAGNRLNPSEFLKQHPAADPNQISLLAIRPSVEQRYETSTPKSE